MCPKPAKDMIRTHLLLRVEGGPLIFGMLVLFYRVESHKFTSFYRLLKFHVVFELSRFARMDFRGFRVKKWPFWDCFGTIKWKVLHENSWNLLETCIWCSWAWKWSFSHLLWVKLKKIGIFHFLGTFFTKTPVSKNNVWVFSRKTGRDRKLKFGTDDPYFVF